MTFCRLSLDLNLYLEVKNSVIFQARSPDLNLDLKGQNFKMTLDFWMEVYLNILNIDLISQLDLSPIDMSKNKHSIATFQDFI